MRESTKFRSKSIEYTWSAHWDLARELYILWWVSRWEWKRPVRSTQQDRQQLQRAGTLIWWGSEGGGRGRWGRRGGEGTGGEATHWQPCSRQSSACAWWSYRAPTVACPSSSSCTDRAPRLHTPCGCCTRTLYNSHTATLTMRHHASSSVQQPHGYTHHVSPRKLLCTTATRLHSPRVTTQAPLYNSHTATLTTCHHASSSVQQPHGYTHHASPRKLLCTTATQLHSPRVTTQAPLYNSHTATLTTRHHASSFVQQPHGYTHHASPRKLLCTTATRLHSPRVTTQAPLYNSHTATLTTCHHASSSVQQPHGYTHHASPRKLLCTTATWLHSPRVTPLYNSHTATFTTCHHASSFVQQPHGYTHHASPRKLLCTTATRLHSPLTRQARLAHETHLHQMK